MLPDHITAENERLLFIIVSLINRGEELDAAIKAVSLWQEASDLAQPQGDLWWHCTTISRLSVACSVYYLKWGDFLEGKIDFPTLANTKVDDVNFEPDLETGIEELDEVFTLIKNIYDQFRAIARLLKRMKNNG
jgi:hypothetical protein